MTYYGGKQKLAKRIVELLPEHVCYVEPFAGGAAVFFAKPKSKVEVLNDHNRLIVNLYRCMQRKPDDLIHRLTWTPYAREEHALAIKLCEEYRGEDLSVDHAWACYVNLMQSYSRMMGNAWRFGLASSAAYLLPDFQLIAKRLALVQIESDDALSVIQRYDSEDTVFYCDPPYPGANQGHYGGYTKEDYRRLWDLLSTVRGSFLLSNYEQGFPTPPRWEKHEFDVALSASSCSAAGTRDRRTEIIYRRSSIDIMSRFKAMRRAGGP